MQVQVNNKHVHNAERTENKQVHIN